MSDGDDGDDDDAQKRRELQLRADNLKASIQLIDDFVKLLPTSKDANLKDQVPIRLEKLESFYNQYMDIIVKLQLLPVEQPAVDYSKRMERFEAKYYELKTALTKALEKKPFLPEGQLKVNLPQAARHVKYPELKLPEFSGNPLDWQAFHDRFVAAVHSSKELSDSEKLSYLTGLVVGKAADVIAGIPTEDQYYGEAWERLNRRYGDKRVLVTAHLAELFDTPAMEKESTEALLKLVDRFDRIVAILKKLGEPTDSWGTILVYQLSLRLVLNTLREWENHVARESTDQQGSTNTEMPKYADMVVFLQSQARIIQALNPLTTSLSTRLREQRPKPATKFSTLHVSQSSTVGRSTTARKCLQCEGAHFLHQCFKFRKFSPKQRFEFVKLHRLCLNCMKTDSHGCRACSSDGCRICGKPHHTLIHLPPLEPQPQGQNSSGQQSSGQSSTNQADFDPGQGGLQLANTSGSSVSSSFFLVHEHTPALTPATPLDTTSPQPETNPPAVLAAHSAKLPSEKVLLCTALVLFDDCCGAKVVARVLLDSGSQFNLMTEALYQKLKLPAVPDHVQLGGVGQLVTNIKKAVETTVSSRSSGFAKALKFLVLPTISCDQPTQPLTTAVEWEIPSWVTLADPTFCTPGAIDALVGAGTFFDLLRYGKVTLGEHLPVLQNTTLGWIVSGEFSDCHTDSAESRHCLLTQDQRLDQLVARFWELEQCTSSTCWSMSEKFCEEHFVGNVARNELGRYVVRLPKKEELVPRLRDNHFNAQRRFLSLERKLDANPTLRAQYEDFINEYIRLGHMREVTPEELAAERDETPRYYLPHLAVLRPESTTTKLRTVFDASCKSCSGLSLNDVLLAGPTIQDTLLSIVLRFRMHAFVVTGDIEKMYRQILVHTADQPLQRILWRGNRTEPLKTYQLLTVTYGTNCAPFLATRVLQQLAEDEKARFPLAAPVVRKDLYMDDLLAGRDDLEELQLLCAELRSIFESAGMCLRKISSNTQEVLNEFPDECREVKSVIEFDTEAPIKALGLLWEPSSDEILYKQPKFTQCQQYTKRIILSQTSTFFDPLGLLGPVVVKAKILIQALWKLEYDWDTPLPEEFAREWEEYQSQFGKLKQFRLPRHVRAHRPQLTEIHGFCDASVDAYGACVYIRTVDQQGCITIRLLTAKSRVAPLDSKSIARLELCAALLLARLIRTVTASIGDQYKVFLWTDSMIVLHWLSATPSTWDTFVANRVAEIQELTAGATWNFVPGHENPADIISRGMDLHLLIACLLWWNSPLWLNDAALPWPQPPELLQQLRGRDLERRRGAAYTIAQQETNLMGKFSSFTTFLRVAALCRRFVHNLRSHAHNRLHPNQPFRLRLQGPVTVDELNETLNAVVCQVQSEHFAAEVAALKAGRNVPHSSTLRYLNPELHAGILRVGGRLKHAGIAADEKNPIVLPRKHPLAYLIAETTHRQHLHCGPQLLLANLRQRFWPLGGRDLVRNVVRSCVTCVKAQPRNLSQLMGSLPAVRVTQAHAFENVGVDYAGPFYLRRSGPRAAPTKSYVSVFVCMATKACHLELVSELTTEAFIACLRRFIARRGRPRNIYCDNATNFVGADRELRELRRLFLSQQHRHEVVNETSAQQVKFHFIPAKSPSYGGLWEACVKSMKFHLRRILGNAFLNSEAFCTVLAQVESCLNSRPITPLSNDPNDMQALTPGHFLIGRPLDALPGPDYSSVPENRLQMWKRLQQYAQHFWSRWHREYLTTLQQRYKWSTQTSNLVKGSLVLLREDSLPMLKWPMGRIVDVHPGADGIVRVASVRLPTGTVSRRAVSRLCVLPVEVDPARIAPTAGPVNDPGSTGSSGDPGNNSTAATAAGPA
ncbi:uncharacterized protein LOC119766311 [Culex quinquefasciatus]|uniref:uncharacterized protein LOC119766311 n=1 Tax=Culex quinquefasciatus TaxID=7176 RepID=UPI0018E35FFF|nr:uncharacterized protein LOC119766311 [Culex quinquefasciatus]